MERIRGKKITSYSITIFMLLLFAAALFPNHLLYGQDAEQKNVRLKQNTQEPRQEQVIQENANSFRECNVIGINKLIRNYYDAYLMKDDTELMKYIDTVGDMNEPLRDFHRAFIEQIMGIRCYYAEGYVEDSYIVISYGYAKYYNYETMVPVIGKFHVRMNSSGSYYICNSVVSSERSAYNEIMFESRQAQEIYEMAQYQLETACEVDTALNEFVTSFHDFFVY